MITVVRPDGTQIVEHSDGTRITTYYDVVRMEVRAADRETGEEAEYESHVCKHVKVECEGFATVVLDTEHGSSRTLFGNGSCIRTETNGECLVEKSDRSKLYFDIKGAFNLIPILLFSPRLFSTLMYSNYPKLYSFPLHFSSQPYPKSPYFNPSSSLFPTLS